jgi:hypothetical protein
MRHSTKFVFGMIVASATIGAFAFLHAAPPPPPQAASTANLAIGHYQLAVNNGGEFLLDTTTGATWISNQHHWILETEALGK